MATINLGTLTSTAVNRFDSVTTSDPTDIYRFNTTSFGNINVALTNISTGDDVDLRLHRDNNNNGVVDSSDTFISSSARGSNADDSINVADQPAGSYIAQANRFSDTGDAFYRILLSTADPSNILPIETQVGDLAADRTFSDQVGNSDAADVYAFSIGFFKGVNINLTGLTTDADIRLIADLNGNRVVDSSEVVLSSAAGGTSSDSIRLDDAGSYYLQVYQYSGNTNYTATFDYFTTPGTLLAPSTPVLLASGTPDVV